MPVVGVWTVLCWLALIISILHQTNNQPSTSYSVYPGYGSFPHSSVSNDDNVGGVDGTVVLGSVLILHRGDSTEGSEILDSRGGNYETRLNLTDANVRVGSNSPRNIINTNLIIN